VPPPVDVGEILAGKYQVERVLGAGGMGVVVAARHLTLGERVAIKFLLPQALGTPEIVGRFLREGQATARLRGEHVARVHDVGKLETGAPFLVMEYLDGKDLGAILKEGGKLPIEAAIDYALQACDALAEAHSAGIVHRDLKPSNLFVIKRLDGTPSVKLIDFGISKIQLPGTGAESDGELTGSAVMMGSPLYMAPEQMASARDVDQRADIWSLGVILHALLAGAPPFRGAAVMQVYEGILKGAAPLRMLREEVPEAVEAAVLKCLRRERDERFADVGELAEALAPHGSAEARATAARVQRIVAAGPREMLALPASDVHVPVATITPAPGRKSHGPAESPSGRTREAAERSSPSSSSQSSGSSAALDPAATAGPWDQRTGPPTRRARPIAIAAVGMIVAACAAIAFFAMRASDTPKPGADPTSHAATTGPTIEPPIVAPSATLPPLASAAPSASASAPARPAVDAAPRRPTATPAGNPAATPAPNPAAAPPRPTAKGKSADDLFGTQK
jgi:serine/threonine-protein kinase